MMAKKILFIDAAHPELEKGLRDMGFSCIHADVSYETLLQTAPDYVGYVIRSKFALDRAILDQSTQLRFIARIGAGMENIDTAYAASKHIECLHSPEGNADAVGEYVIASTLLMLRKLPIADREVRQGIWDRESNRGMELHSKTFGIVGYGHMGEALAKKLSGFGCRVIAYDKYKSGFGDAYVEECSLSYLQKEADIVSIHINYMPENLYYIHKEWIEAFEKDIFLINSSRGKVLHTADLIQCLQSGKIRMAALDVLEYEDIRLRNRPKKAWDEAMRYIAGSDKVLLSPHIAGQTLESSMKHARILLGKIQRIFNQPD
ncbi:MAG: NAD(P)-dependent oxidoreductase [Bacteroidales bacterium]